MSALAPGLCSVTFRALDWTRALELAASAGMKAIEWGGDVHVPPGDLTRARAVGSATRARGLASASYGSYFEAGVTPQAALATVFQTARELGAASIRVWAGRRGVDSADVSPADRKRTIESLRDACESAADHGLSVALEFHRQTLTDTLASTLDLLDSVDHPALLSYWQPRIGIELDEALHELEALKPRLLHLHVFQWNVRRERLPLADGASFWPHLLERVAAWNDARSASRCAFIEFVAGDEPAAFARDAQTLREWTSRTNDVHGKRGGEAPRPMGGGTDSHSGVRAGADRLRCCAPGRRVLPPRRHLRSLRCPAARRHAKGPLP